MKEIIHEYKNIKNREKMSEIINKKKYKVTQKGIYCSMHCSFFRDGGHILDCIENCNESAGMEVVEETTEMTIEQLIDTINRGNCVITKVW